MKRNVSLVTLVLIVAVVLAACGGAAGGSPAAAAKAWFDAFSKLDLDGMKALTCESQKTALDDSLGALTGGGDLAQLKDLITFDFSGLKFEEKNVSGNSATVHVSGDMKVAAFGQSQTEPMDTDFPMVNEGGAWKVCAAGLPGN